MRILLSSALALSVLVAILVVLYVAAEAPPQAAAAMEARSRSAASFAARGQGPAVRSFEAFLALTALQAEAKQSRAPLH